MSYGGAAYSVLYLPTPEGLVFEGTTDDEGKIFVSFPNRELRLGSDFEFGLESFTIDSGHNSVNLLYFFLFFFQKQKQKGNNWFD